MFIQRGEHGLLIPSPEIQIARTMPAKSYSDKVKWIAPANLIAYWPLWEASGSVADNLEGTAARDGTYANVTLGQTGIGDGNTCPLFNGTTSYVDGFSDSLVAAFAAAEGTLLVWAKVANAGIWTDGTLRLLFKIRFDGSNLIQIWRSTTNGTIAFDYSAGGTNENVTIGSLSSTNWLTFCLTWSKTADEVKAYINGEQAGNTQTTLGTWTGTPTTITIGVTHGKTSNFWSGWIAHPVLWTKALTPAQIASLAVV